MATIKLSAAKSASAAISYAEGKGKLGEETKDWLREHGVSEDVVVRLSARAVAVGGENVDLEHVRGQMRATRELFRKNTGVQAHRVIQSFAMDDLNAANPADWERANALGVELGRQIAPGHEVAVYTHIDGEGHKLHNHIIINAPDLETGEKYHQHNDFARVTKLNDQLAREHGLSVIKEPSQHERRSIAERHIDAVGYVWKDDLRRRIDQAMLDPRTNGFEGFSAVLSEKGVDIRVRGKNVSYAFLDPNQAHRVSRGNKLGLSYEKGAIEDELARRTEQQQQRAVFDRISNQVGRAEQELRATDQSAGAGERTVDAVGQHIRSINRQLGGYHKRIRQVREVIDHARSGLAELVGTQLARVKAHFAAKPLKAKSDQYPTLFGYAQTLLHVANSQRDMSALAKHLTPRGRSLIKDRDLALHNLDAAGFPVNPTLFPWNAAEDVMKRISNSLASLNTHIGELNRFAEPAKLSVHEQIAEAVKVQRQDEQDLERSRERKQEWALQQQQMWEERASAPKPNRSKGWGIER
ncbi:MULTISPECIES: relaxase/mobilization nuclease domain-containing protein [Lacticaseibacillus]|uniref:relaxase/mobilization nuclease domain-containing protein n=1 Tax=Lacticaseibacillus TaxID=2759736 RepID=UPI001943D4BF|nr:MULTISPECIES: relaxase/mobilization nuclease domain-containing protein [Lacticaseibacillus]